MLKNLFFLLFSLTLTPSFGQEKQLDDTQQRIELEKVQYDIDKITTKIAHIEYRISTLPKDRKVDPTVLENIQSLQSEKEHLEKVKASIESYLGIATATKAEIKEITREQFDKYPKENQELILAHPERYKIVD